MSDFEQQQPGRRGIDRIIRSRGETPTYGQEEGANDAQRYEAFLTTEGFPQMGFSVFCTNGQRHGFFYHNLDSIDLTEGKHGQYLKLTHRGKAMTMRGHGLHALFQAIMDHTLQAVYEYSEAVYPALGTGEAVIERIRVDELGVDLKTT